MPYSISGETLNVGNEEAADVFKIQSNPEAKNVFQFKMTREW